jgi:xyloglucan-specific endo-beta-1,4-glucanase
MKFTQATALPLIFSDVLAAPAATLEERATTYCDTWDVVAAGGYTLYQNLWGKSAATSGSQCATLNSASSSSVAWSTSWSWAGGKYNVKSYDNVALKMSSAKVSSISSIPTSWKWSITGSSIVADVSYDMFTSSSSSGSNEYEIMVWVAALGGAGPISTSGSPVGSLTVDGTVFELYKGPNGSTTVYSFVAKTETKDFSGDLKLFFNYLVNNEGYPSSQYLLSIQAGTEPFTGSSVVLTTSSYSVSVK